MNSQRPWLTVLRTRARFRGDGPHIQLVVMMEAPGPRMYREGGAELGSAREGARPPAAMLKICAESFLLFFDRPKRMRAHEAGVSSAPRRA